MITKEMYACHDDLCNALAINGFVINSKDDYKFPNFLEAALIYESKTPYDETVFSWCVYHSRDWRCAIVYQHSIADDWDRKRMYLMVCNISKNAAIMCKEITYKNIERQLVAFNGKASNETQRTDGGG